MGNSRELLLQFVKTSANNWTRTGSIDGNAVTLTISTVTFGTAGNLSSTGTIAFTGYPPSVAIAPAQSRAGTKRSP